MVIVVFFIALAAIFLFAFYIDWRRRKRNNHPARLTDAHGKKGEDSNYLMGDYKDMGGDW
ncbi:hypothetical protein [Bacillus sp. 1P06AnD]|uniref:hypothetical protein n=1 Tax=Bacillus sp. 1P06AnD TaxID=3132208 RepID=UPI0039A382DF